MQTIRALMEHIIDYAGLFPPAELDMPAAVQNYGKYLDGSHSWMLGRFIVPVARLGDFESAAATLLPRDAAEPWRISALAAAADDRDSLQRDLDSIAAFNDRHTPAADLGAAVIDAIELRAAAGRDIEHALELVPDEITPFFELSLDRDFRGLLAAIAGCDACAKLRTGGVRPDLFPTSEAVARFIAACAAADVPFKATAGLHHPFTHASATVAGATEFGFINLFLAAGLARHERISIEAMTEFLAEQDPQAFRINDDAIEWRGSGDNDDARGGSTSLSVDDIERTRGTFALSYGSCSFVEPIDDLKSLNVMAEGV